MSVFKPGASTTKGLGSWTLPSRADNAGLDAVDDTTFEAERHLLKTDVSRLRCDLKIRTCLWRFSQGGQTRIELVLKIELLGQRTQQRANCRHIDRD